MLCDQLVAFAKSPVGVTTVHRIAYDEVAARITRSPRFVLQRDACLMIHNVSESTPSRMLSALDICRLPFPSIWVEFEFRHRKEWLDAAVQRGTMGVENRADSSPPTHLGFLLERLDKEGRIIRILPVWKHPFTEQVSICNLALTINTSADIPEPPQEQFEVVREYLESETPPNRWVRDPREVRAATLVNARIDEDMPDFLAPMWATLMDRNPALADRMLDMARFDLRMEWRFAVGLLVAINSRNLLRYGEEESYARLNKSRIKSGKLPLLSHQEIRLHLSRVQQRRMGYGGGTRGTAAAHLVRGHFKLRQSGIFWWSDHVRSGSEADASPKTYRVGG